MSVAFKKRSKKTVEKSQVKTQLDVAYHFPCPIYLIERPDFLKEVTILSEELLVTLREKQKLNEIYPVYMSDNFFDNNKVTEFTKFVGATAWNILNEQGYAMQDKVVSFTEMWTQEHYKHSSMEQHIHGFGAQIVGFYFLEVPEGSSRVVFHDPRAGKVQINLPEQDMSMATIGSNMINFEAKEGLMIFSNAWMPHSFTKHENEKPIKFVHFNLSVQFAPQQTCAVPAAEVI